ncbi:MAG: D-aminoacyl-tRNA deacylase, partial [Lachnospiraceae bacterium]|nr:D-aminoacyl-tRNA deacylase [Lachnospiraceae bacterium]
PEHAKEIYEYMIGEFTDKYGLKCDTGEFGAHMKVSLINDGPFTVVLDSDELFGGKA